MATSLIPSPHMCVLVAQSCLTLCDPVDCSPPGSSVHGILQARILEWVALSSSRGSSWPRDQICISCLLHCRWMLYLLSHWGSPMKTLAMYKCSLQMVISQHFQGTSHCMCTHLCINMCQEKQMAQYKNGQKAWVAEKEQRGKQWPQTMRRKGLYRCPAGSAN